MNLLEAAELAVVLARNAKQPHPPFHAVAQTVARLRRLGRRALTNGVNWCNVPGYYGDVAEKRAQSIKKGTLEALKGYRLASETDPVHVGGDPRGGSCLTVYFADGSSNRFDRDGWSI